MKILKIKIIRKYTFYYANKKNQIKNVTIADDLYDQVMNFKNFKKEKINIIKEVR